MSTYVDGYVLPIPKDSLDTYRKIARKAGKIWIEHGALQYKEYVADDVPAGKLTSFPLSVKLNPTEVVIFAWVVFKSRAHRDRVNAKVMSDQRMHDMDIPFDGKRMIYGGFKPLVDL